MTQARRAALWIGGGFAAALAAAAAVLGLRGTDEAGIQLAVLMSARVAFMFFWPAYAGGAVARLAGPALAGLARRGREFGLAFAAALLVHLALVAWLFRISAQPPVGDAVIVTFGIGALSAYALALFSLDPLGRLASRKTWRIARTVGVEYIAVLFFYDFALLPLRNGVTHPLEYAPFAVLIVAGALLRLAALSRRRGPGPAVTTGAGPRAQH